MSQESKHSAAIKQMVNFFQSLMKQHQAQDDLGYSEMIPLLAESYFDGEIKEDQKVYQYLGPVQNEDIKVKILNKLKQVKQKQQKKRQAAKAEKIKQPPKEKPKEKEKIFDRIQPAPPKNNEAPKKKVKHEKNQMQIQQNKKQKRHIEQEQIEGEVHDLEHKEGLKKQLQKQGKQKCKFFPYCKNQQTCQYFHPTQKVIKIRGPSKEIKKNTT